MKSFKHITKKQIESKYFEIFPKLKEKNTQKFTTLVLTIVALIIFGFFAINPTLSTIAQLKKELKDNQEVAEKLDQKIKNLAMLQQRYFALSDDLPKIFSSIPQTPDITTLIGQLQALSRQSNITIIRLQTFEVELPKKDYSNIQNINDYSEFTFSLGIEGSYENLLNFMTDISNFDRIITTDNISIGKAAGKENVLQLDIKGKTYFKR